MKFKDYNKFNIAQYGFLVHKTSLIYFVVSFPIAAALLTLRIMGYDIDVLYFLVAATIAIFTGVYIGLGTYLGVKK